MKDKWLDMMDLKNLISFVPWMGQRIGWHLQYLQVISNASGYLVRI